MSRSRMPAAMQQRLEETGSCRHGWDLRQRGCTECAPFGVQRNPALVVCGRHRLLAAEAGDRSGSYRLLGPGLRSWYGDSRTVHGSPISLVLDADGQVRERTAVGSPRPWATASGFWVVCERHDAHQPLDGAGLAAALASGRRRIQVSDVTADH